MEQRTLNLVTVWGLAAAFCALVTAGPLCLGWTTVFLMRAAVCQGGSAKCQGRDSPMASLRRAISRKRLMSVICCGCGVSVCAREW